MIIEGGEAELRFHLHIHNRNPIPLALVGNVISVMYEAADGVCREWIDDLLPDTHGDALLARTALHDALARYQSELILLDEVFGGSSNFRGKFKNWMYGAIAGLAIVSGHKYVEDVLVGLDVYNYAVTHAQDAINRATHRFEKHAGEAHKKRGGREGTGYAMEIKFIGPSEILINIYPNEA